MDEKPLFNENGSPSKNYNLLLSMLHKHGEGLDLLTDIVQEKTIDKTKVVQSSQSLRACIDAAPLYALTPAAERRSYEVAKELKNRSIAQAPTISVGGVTVADSMSAVFMQSDDDALRAYKAFTDSIRLDPYFAGHFVYAYEVWDEHKRHVQQLTKCTAISGTVDGEIKTVVVSAISLYFFPADNCCDAQIFNTAVAAPGSSSSFVSIALAVSIDRRGKVRHTSPIDRESTLWYMVEMMKQPQSLVDQLLYLDQPTHYIVEERPAHVPAERKLSQARPAYSNDRERWIVLDPEEVKVRFARRTDVPLGGTHASPIPHLRRAHNRTLRAERYTFKRGTVVHIRPTWIGDREWEEKKLCYRVVSRLGATENQA